jgi:hypothetical protein
MHANVTESIGNAGSGAPATVVVSTALAGENGNYNGYSGSSILPGLTRLRARSLAPLCLSCVSHLARSEQKCAQLDFQAIFARVKPLELLSFRFGFLKMVAQWNLIRGAR